MLSFIQSNQKLNFYWVLPSIPLQLRQDLDMQEKEIQKQMDEQIVHIKLNIDTSIEKLARKRSKGSSTINKSRVFKQVKSKAKNTLFTKSIKIKKDC